jgi:threonine/homoserine/homoserine lactone efflux protein
VESLVLFVTAVLLLLLIPGPTNTLLATSGATVGFRRSVPLLLGELAGYLSAILLLRAILDPAATRMPAVPLVMRVAAGLYLVLLCYRLWTTPLSVERAVISVRQVFTTTLLNPKALAFAVLIVPFGSARFQAYLGVFAAMVPAIGTLWIGAGHALGRHTRASRQKIIPKAAALILAVFSVVLIGSAVIPRPH